MGFSRMGLFVCCIYACIYVCMSESKHVRNEMICNTCFHLRPILSRYAGQHVGRPLVLACVEQSLNRNKSVTCGVCGVRGVGGDGSNLANIVCMYVCKYVCMRQRNYLHNNAGAPSYRSSKISHSM